MYFKILENNISIVLNCSIVLTALAEVPVPVPSTPHYVVIKPEIIYIYRQQKQTQYFSLIYIHAIHISMHICMCTYIYMDTQYVHIYVIAIIIGKDSAWNINLGVGMEELKGE